MDEDALFELIDQIYEGVFDPALWPQVLHRIARASDSLGAVIIPIHGLSDLPPMASPDLWDAGAVYEQDWSTRDSRVERYLSRDVPDAHWDDRQFFSAAEIAREPFFQDFLRPFGMGTGFGSTASPLPGTLFSLSIQRPLGAEPATASQRALVARLSRHVNRALAVAARVETATLARDGLANSLSDLGCATAVIEPGGKVVLTNGAFERLAPDGLRIVQGRLRTDRRDQQGSLDALIRGASAPGRAGPEADVMALARPSGLRPLILRAVPLPADRAAPLLTRVSAGLVLLLAVDLGKRSGRTPEAVLRRLGLTPSEARIAALVGTGLSPKEAAEIARIKEGTARSLLKQAFAKLDVSRQSELARLVAQLSLLLGTEPDAAARATPT